jgi:hypothetical protein
MSVVLELTVDCERYELGETVRGTILVVEGGSVRSLEALLVFSEETETSHSIARTISSGELRSGDLARGDWVEFGVVVPADAPPTYTSKHGRLYWSVAANADVAFRSDAGAIAEIEVAAGPDAAP